MKLRLTSRLVLFFLLLAAVLLVTVGMLSYRSGSKSLENAAMADMLGNAIEKAAQLDTWFEERLHDIQLISTHADIVDEAANLVAAAPASEEARAARAVLMGELQPYIDSFRSRFSELFVMDPETGKVVASTSPAEEGKLKVGRPYFDKGRTDLYLQAPYYSADLAAPAMTVAVPLRAAGRLVAVLAGRLNLDDINLITQRRTGLRRTEDSYLVNPERVLATQPRFIREPAVLRRTLDTESVRRVVAGNNGVMLTPDYRGIPSIAAFRWSASHQLGLIVEMDQAEALAPAHAFGWSVVLISSLALLAAAGLAVLLAGTIARPLLELHDRVRRFGEGSVKEPLLQRSGDEVSLLTREFDRMAARISERTGELARANAALQAENVERQRVEESLQAKERSLSESQRLGHIGSWFYDLAGPMTWSDEMFRLFGVTSATVSPSAESLINVIHPDDRQSMLTWIAASAAGAKPIPLEFRVVMLDGTSRFMRGSGETVFDATNRPLYMAGMVQDITERKEGESALVERARLSALAADVGASLTRGLSLHDMLQGCAAALVQHLDAAFARVWTLNEQTSVPELQASAGMYTPLDGPHGRVPSGTSTIGLIAEQRRPHVTNHVIDDPRVSDQEWATREGMVSFAGYPLEVNGRVVGVMALFARQLLPDATRDAMAGIANGIALGIERMRTDAALRESEQRMRLQTAALESAANGVAITDVTGEIQWVNRAFTELTGYSAEEAIGRNPRLLKSGQHAQLFYEEMWQTISRGQAWKGEIVNRRKDGRVYHEDMTITPVRDSQGAVAHFVAVKQDITERKQAQEELRRKTALLEAQLESALDGILVLDNEGRHILENDRFIEMWRISRDAAEEPDGRKRLEFAATRTKNPTQFLERAAYSSSHPDEIMHDEIEMAGGAVLERHSGPVRGRDGKHYGRIFNFRDITASKLAQEEREKFAALIESSADFIGMATLEGKPLFLNTAGRDMVGLDRDLSSTSIAEFFDGDTAALVQNTGIPAAFAAGHWMGEGRLRHFQTHALIPVHMHAILVKNPATGEPICIATVQRNITDIKEAEKRLEKANRELIDVSRLSGMAEVATSVLHNVGNVLNSVNVSADRISEKVKRLKPASLEKVAALLRAHAHDLPEFLTRDPQGKELPGYLGALVEQLADPQKDILPELVSLRNNVDHIREIVRTQQKYARGASVLETIALTDLMEDAISINAASLTRHQVRLIREYSPVPTFPIDKHKVLQILVNLLSNAKYALDAGDGRDSRLTVGIDMNGGDTVTVSVTDNGVGIAPENLSRMFEHGFTTREGGHGFGLHSGALAAQELGGSLTAASGGPGQGAVFTLELPCRVTEPAA